MRWLRWEHPNHVLRAVSITEQKENNFRAGSFQVFAPGPCLDRDSRKIITQPGRSETEVKMVMIFCLFQPSLQHREASTLETGLPSLVKSLWTHSEIVQAKYNVRGRSLLFNLMSKPWVTHAVYHCGARQTMVQPCLMLPCMPHDSKLQAFCLSSLCPCAELDLHTSSSIGPLS